MGNARIWALIALACSASGCGEDPVESRSEASAGSAEKVEETTQSTDPSPSSETEESVMKALGYVKGDDGWRDPKCDSINFAELRELKDLNGDGQAEAVVAYDSDECHGQNQRLVSIFRKQGGKWVELVNYQTRFMVDTFYPRKGIAWPDIEYFDGMFGEQAPDGAIRAVQCVPFLRWNGKEYVSGGKSKNGDICEFAPEFASAGSAGKSAATRFPPVPEGYYAFNVSCAQAAKGEGTFIRFDRKSWTDIDGRFPIKITAKGNNRWSLDLDGGGPMEITITGPDGFTDEYGAKITHCPSTQVPQSEQARLKG